MLRLNCYPNPNSRLTKLREPSVDGAAEGEERKTGTLHLKGEGVEDPLRNTAINLRANGPAAVMILWIICVAALGLYGTGPQASSALTILSGAGGMILLGLASRA